MRSLAVLLVLVFPAVVFAQRKTDSQINAEKQLWPMVQKLNAGGSMPYVRQDSGGFRKCREMVVDGSLKMSVKPSDHAEKEFDGTVTWKARDECSKIFSSKEKASSATEFDGEKRNDSNGKLYSLKLSFANGQWALEELQWNTPNLGISPPVSDKANPDNIWWSALKK